MLIGVNLTMYDLRAIGSVIVGRAGWGDGPACFAWSSFMKSFESYFR